MESTKFFVDRNIFIIQRLWRAKLNDKTLKIGLLFLSLVPLSFLNLFNKNKAYKLVHTQSSLFFFLPLAGLRCWHQLRYETSLPRELSHRQLLCNRDFTSFWTLLSTLANGWKEMFNHREHFLLSLCSWVEM